MAMGIALSNNVKQNKEMNPSVTDDKIYVSVADMTDGHPGSKFSFQK